jgi:hypothetical protein
MRKKALKTPREKALNRVENSGIVGCVEQTRAFRGTGACVRFAVHSWDKPEVVPPKESIHGQEDRASGCDEIEPGGV